MTYEEIKEKLSKGQLVVLSLTKMIKNNKVVLEDRTTYVISGIIEYDNVYEVTCEICIFERKHHDKNVKDVLNINYNTSETVSKDILKKFKDCNHKKITSYILNSVERNFNLKMDEAVSEYLEARKTLYNLINGVKPYI